MAVVERVGLSVGKDSQFRKAALNRAERTRQGL